MKDIFDALQASKPSPSQEAMFIIKNMADNLLKMGTSPANKSEFLYILAEKLELTNPKGAHLEAMRCAYSVARYLAD